MSTVLSVVDSAVILGVMDVDTVVFSVVVVVGEVWRDVHVTVEAL